MVKENDNALSPEKVEIRRKFAFLPIYIKDQKVWFKKYYRLDVYFKVLLDEIISFKLTYNFLTWVELCNVLKEYKTSKEEGCDKVE